MKLAYRRPTIAKYNVYYVTEEVV